MGGSSKSPLNPQAWSQASGSFGGLVNRVAPGFGSPDYAAAARNAIASHPLAASLINPAAMQADTVGPKIQNDFVPQPQNFGQPSINSNPGPTMQPASYAGPPPVSAPNEMAPAAPPASAGLFGQVGAPVQASSVSQQPQGLLAPTSPPATQASPFDWMKQLGIFGTPWS